VIKKDIKQNILVVGTESEADLYSHELIATERHRVGTTPPLPLAAHAKIRYRQEDQEAVIDINDVSTMKITFSKPQRAIASGQIVAVYQ